MLHNSPARPNSVDSESQRTPRSRSALSVPRELSLTPAISSIHSNIHTPLIQKCHVKEEGTTGSEAHPCDHMTVMFEGDQMQLTTKSLLGKGGFGRVYVAQSSGGELCALKVSSKQMTDSDWERLRKEVALMSHFSQHPNVVKLIAAGRDRDFAYVAMECCASRSLHDIIARHGLEVPEMLWIGYALVDTIAFLHAKGCIHRDLKPQNLLFDFDGNLKISDFGLSSNVTESEPRKTVAGTAMYMAPEIAGAVCKRMTNGEGAGALRYGQEVDTWSIGIVFYVMLTRMNPYSQALENEGAHGMSKTQKTLTLFNAVAGALWKWPAGWKGDEELCHVVSQILHRDPGKRITLQAVLKHPVWDRRPLSCPLSLLQKLNLVERPQLSRSATVSRSRSRAPEVMQLQCATKTPEAVFSEGVSRLVRAEESTRTQLVLESNEVINLVFNVLQLHVMEAGQRRHIAVEEKGCRSNIESKRSTDYEIVRASVLRRQPVHGKGNNPSRRPPRESSVMLVQPSSIDQEDVFGEVVRTTPDRYAVVYNGRGTATRWSLRDVISLPREFNNEIEEFKCMNNHRMMKLIKMPLGFEGFDCNVCDIAINKINVERPAFRCAKCDYDLCMKCAYEGTMKDVNFVCVSCAKKFTSSRKLQAHTAMCRGPSVSLSRRCSSRRNTMLWEHQVSSGGSMLDVRLPVGTRPPPSPRVSGRSSGCRRSSGGRISVGDSYVPEPEDVGAMVVAHREATFPKMPSFSTPVKDVEAVSSPSAKESTVKRGEGSFSFELPPQVRLSKHCRETGLEPRSSAELREIVSELTPILKKTRTEGGEKVLEVEAKKVTKEGSAAHIAAGTGADGRTSVQEGEETRNFIVIRGDNAAKPQDMPKQPRVPRSVSSSLPRNRVEAPAVDNISKPPLKNSMARVKRCVSASGESLVPRMSLPSTHTGEIFGAVPLPRMPTPGRCSLPRSVPCTVAATRSTAPRQMSQPLVNLLGGAPTAGYCVETLNPDARNAAISSANRAAGSGYGGPAFLALPQDKENRQRFVGDFLSGAWVRFYSFCGSDVVAMYYSVQPGRYGALFPTEEGAATAVLDIHSKLVLYVPRMDKDAITRTQSHPNVLSFFQDEIRILPVTSAERTLGAVLRGITGFVKELAERQREGKVCVAVQSAYVYQREKGAVPASTKFAYVRKAFPDPAGSFVLFRLSNLRSQVICNNALVDIRWQSDKNHNVGQKYYVHANGEAEPFTVERAGVLNQIDMVIRNVYRK